MRCETILSRNPRELPYSWNCHTKTSAANTCEDLAQPTCNIQGCSEPLRWLISTGHAVLSRSRCSWRCQAPNGNISATRLPSADRKTVIDRWPGAVFVAVACSFARRRLKVACLPTSRTIPTHHRNALGITGLISNRMMHAPRSTRATKNLRYIDGFAIRSRTSYAVIPFARCQRRHLPAPNH